MRWVVRAVVIVAAIGGPALAFAGEKNVRLDVDGRVRPLSTYATSAPDLLERIGLRASSRDLVSPSGSLDAGDTVLVRRAKPIQLWLDGEPRTVWATGLTVGEALTAMGMAPGQGAFVAPDPALPLVDGLPVVLRNAVHTTVRVDGEVRDVVSSAETVRALLADAGIDLGGRDFVRPTPGTRPAKGMAIRVVRVRKATQTSEVRVPFSYTERKDPSLDRGVRKLVQQGAEGLTVRRYEVTTEDGKAVSRKLLSERVVRRPQDQIVRVGTGQPAFTGSGRSEEGVASWFGAEGLVAAHRTLPMGTVVKVTDPASGKSVTVRVNQRGPFVEDRIIDLSDDAFAALAPVGRGTLRVRIQW